VTTILTVAVGELLLVSITGVPHLSTSLVMSACRVPRRLLMPPPCAALPYVLPVGLPTRAVAVAESKTTGWGWRR
jgi:hypothetical protein